MKTFKNIEFIKSISKYDQFPDSKLDGVCFLGRSNVGKSSLINALCNSKKIARISKTPGKTITLNIFNINNNFLLVDSPGFGYAKRSRETYQKFQKLLDTFLQKTEKIKLFVLLIDIRRGVLEDEKLLIDFLKFYSRKIWIVFTKSDKLSGNVFRNTKKKLEKNETISEYKRFFMSSNKSYGEYGETRENFCNMIYRELKINE